MSHVADSPPTSPSRPAPRAETAARRPAPQEAPAREYLSFRLGAEEYGIDLLRVQEIRSYEQPTRIAGAPPHMLGVTNLRGTIVPIADLRCRLGVEPAFGTGTVTVVVNVGGRTFGAVVDGVSDVVALEPGLIKPAPRFTGAVDSRHLTGIAALGDGATARMLILIDIEALMCGDEMGLVA